MNILKEKFKNISGGKILDVGTGSGSFIPVFLEFFKDYSEVIGIDFEEKNLERAQKNFNQDNIKFMCMSADNMSFEDNSFDTICISNTLHHLPNMDEVLKEMKRVLKPGGLFIVNEMFCDNQSEKQLTHVYLHHLAAELDTLLGTYHSDTFKRQQIVDSVNNTGLNVVDIFENNHEDEIDDFSEEKQKEAIDGWFNYIEKQIEKVEDVSKANKFKKRMEELKCKLYDVGIFDATELVVLGRKNM